MMKSLCIDSMVAKRITLLFILCLASTSVLAQSQDSTTQEKLSIQSVDSLVQSKPQKLDSLQSSIDQKLDTVQVLSNKINHLTDSLAPDLSCYNNAFDSVRNKLSFRIDSLNQLKLPTEKYTRLLDSLNQLGPAKSVSQAKQRLAEAQIKVDRLEGKVNRPLNNVEGKINDKLSLMRREGGEGANLPGNVDLPGVTSSDLPGVDSSLPSAKLDIPEGQAGLTNPLSNSQAGGLPDFKKDIPGIDGLGKIQNDLGEVKEVTGQVSAYGEDVKNIGSGNLGEVKQVPETIENEAVENAPVGDLQSQTKMVAEYKEIIRSGNDKQALKKQALQQAPKLAKNHFKGQEAALQQAMDKMNSYKSKYTELTSLENIPKHKPNEMKGKPFAERLVPSITLQIQRAENVWLDYNLSAGYRISGRFMAGLGWNERVGITDKFGFTSADRIYGPRTYLEFRLKKGLSVRADGEKMNVFVPPYAYGPSDEGGRQWIWSAFIGMKKEYYFLKSVRGNFQFLYNLYDDHDQSPYVSRFSVRMGFEFPQKKRVKE